MSTVYLNGEFMPMDEDENGTYLMNATGQFEETSILLGSPRFRLGRVISMTPLLWDARTPWGSTDGGSETWTAKRPWGRSTRR